MTRPNSRRRGFMLLDKIFAVFMVGILSSAAAYSSVVAYTSCRGAGKRLAADQVAARSLAAVQAHPSRFAPGYRATTTVALPTTTYSVECRVQAYAGCAGLSQAGVTVRWRERGVGHILRRTRLIAEGGQS